MGTNKDDPLRALACATDETPTYMTSALIRGKLYLSAKGSVLWRVERSASLIEARNKGDPRLRRYWSRAPRKSPPRQTGGEVGQDRWDGTHLRESIQGHVTQVRIGKSEVGGKCAEDNVPQLNTAGRNSIAHREVIFAQELWEVVQ